MSEVTLYLSEAGVFRLEVIGRRDTPLDLSLSGSLRLFTEMCSGSEAGSYWRLIDSCITQLKAQGPSRTCN